MSENTKAKPESLLPNDEEFRRRLKARHRRGTIGKIFYIASIAVAIGALTLLFMDILNETFGMIAVQNEVEPETLTGGRELSELSEEELVTILTEHAANRLRVVIRDNLSAVDSTEFTSSPLSAVLAGRSYPEEFADLTMNDLEETDWANLLVMNMDHGQLEGVILEHVVKQQVLESWPLFDTIFNRDQIIEVQETEYPDAELQFHSWISGGFLSKPMSSTPANAGIRTALLGSIYMMILVIVIAFPLGIGAALYLQEYASDNRFNRIVETNVRNLAGVPSIIYGMLGLAIFVRAFEVITSGAAVGIAGGNGRTILSASFTLAILILPIIIISAQEALRAVPQLQREASYGLGATKWQTIWRAVLPSAMPGILTGTILAISRAVGETAPLIVVGASTFILVDPNGPFSKFTALPIQIYQWTARPQDQFRDIAAAAIVVLLILLLTLNATAIFLRNRYSIEY